MIRVAFGSPTDPILVDVESEALAAAVRALFPSRLVDLPSGASEARQAHMRVEGVDGRYRLLPADTGYEALPDLMSAVEFAIVGHLLRRAKGFTHLHAGGVVVDGRAIVALGESGAGKSSLSLAWSRAGFPLLGDDTILLDDGGQVSAFPRLLKVDRERLAEHGLALEATVAPDPDHPEAWVTVEEGGGWWTGAAPVGVLARVRYDAGSTTRITELEGVAGLRALLECTLAGGRSPGDSMDRYLALLERARIVAVTFGSALDAAEALATLARDPEPMDRTDP